MRRNWLAPLCAIAGIMLIGLANLARLLGAPLEAQRGYLVQSIFPLVVGLWLLVGGVYGLKR